MIEHLQSRGYWTDAFAHNYLEHIRFYCPGFLANLAEVDVPAFTELLHQLNLIVEEQKTAGDVKVVVDTSDDLMTMARGWYERWDCLSIVTGRVSPPLPAGRP